MRKFFIDKNDAVASVVEKIISEKDPEIVLVIPKNSQVKDSVSNFHLIKREADSAKKTVTVESVDEEVLALARAAKLESIHPLLSVGGQERSLLDIIPGKSKEAATPRAAKAAKSQSRKLEVQAEPAPAVEIKISESKSVTKEPTVRVVRDETLLLEESPRRRLPVRLVIVCLVIVVLIGGAAWVMSTVFARAEVKINFNEVPWTYNGGLTASKEAVKITAASKLVPAEIFRDKRNSTQFFPASGKAQVSQKAKGKMTIYNGYSSQPQTLVATTRFSTPDGKIFRLDNQVLVPGAEIKDGKIIPASIDTTVTADKAGTEYNVGPAAKLTIPGFKGTPRYDAFHGELKEGTSGGFIGERAVPTDADINTAKEKTSQILRASLDTNLLAGRPSEFKILDGASQVDIVRLTVNKNTDDQGNFSIMGEAEYRAIGFREEDMRLLLTELATQSTPNYVFRRNPEISYPDVKADYTKGELKFTVEAKGELVPAFDADGFKSSVLGQNVNQVRNSIRGLEGLSEAKVSLWPFWLKTLPQDPERVTLQVE
ncbi:MAG: hypothetical protein AAB686_01230 [Patescibacteria group bacterium]